MGTIHRLDGSQHHVPEERDVDEWWVRVVEPALKDAPTTAITLKEVKELCNAFMLWEAAHHPLELKGMCEVAIEAGCKKEGA